MLEPAGRLIVSVKLAALLVTPSDALIVSALSVPKILAMPMLPLI